MTPTVIDGVLSYPIWVKIGFGMINRDCLDHDHPQQTYNYLKTNGIKPEDFGIKHPRLAEMEELFRNKSKEDLMLEIMDLRDELHAMQKNGF